MVTAVELVVLLFISGCNSFEITQPFSKDKVMHFDKFLDACPDMPNTSSTFSNMRLVAPQGKLFDYEYITRRRITKALITIDMERCASREAPDTCIKLTTLRSNRVCEMLGSDHDFWSGAFTCTKPRLFCPVAIGTSSGRNCSFNMELFRWFPVSPTAYYKTRVIVENVKPRFVFTCIESNWQLKRRH